MGHLDSQRSLPAIKPDLLGLSPIAKKLRLALEHHVAVLNAPDGYLALLQPGPADINTELVPSASYDAVVLFVKDVAELRRLGAPAIHAAKPNGLLWITYPKGGSARGMTDLPATPSWVQRASEAPRARGRCERAPRPRSGGTRALRPASRQ